MYKTLRLARADHSSVLERAGKRRLPASEILQDFCMRQNSASVEVTQSFGDLTLELFFVIETSLQSAVQHVLPRSLPALGEARDAPWK